MRRATRSAWMADNPQACIRAGFLLSGVDIVIMRIYSQITPRQEQRKMNDYKITYTRGDSQRALSFEVEAESEGEALEIWDDYVDGIDDCCEFVSICEQ